MNSNEIFLEIEKIEIEKRKNSFYDSNLDKKEQKLIELLFNAIKQNSIKTPVSSGTLFSNVESRPKSNENVSEKDILTSLTTSEDICSIFKVSICSDNIRESANLNIETNYKKIATAFKAIVAATKMNTVLQQQISNGRIS